MDYRKPSSELNKWKCIIAVGSMNTLHVGHGHSKGSSRSQSPSTAELARDPAVTDDAVIRSRVQSPSTAHHVSVSRILDFLEFLLSQNVVYTTEDKYTEYKKRIFFLIQRCSWRKHLQRNGKFKYIIIMNGCFGLSVSRKR